MLRLLMVLGTIIHFYAADPMAIRVTGFLCRLVAVNVIMGAHCKIDLTAADSSDRFSYHQTTCALYFDINSASAIF